MTPVCDLPLDAEFRYHGRTWVKRSQLPGRCLCVSTDEPPKPREFRTFDCGTEVERVEPAGNHE